MFKITLSSLKQTLIKFTSFVNISRNDLRKKKINNVKENKTHVWNRVVCKFKVTKLYHFYFHAIVRTSFVHFGRWYF